MPNSKQYREGHERIFSDAGMLRTMDSNGTGDTCPYCNKSMPQGTLIAGEYGVRWGHKDCVYRALTQGELIASPNSASRRPIELLPYITRAITMGPEGNLMVVSFCGPHAVKTKEEFDTKLEQVGELYAHYGRRPARKKNTLKKKLERTHKKKVSSAHASPQAIPKSCSFFPARHIMTIVMPHEIRPDMGSVYADIGEHRVKTLGPSRLLEEDPFKGILERIWRELIEKKFSHYKLTQRGGLPICDVHQWARVYTDKICHLEVKEVEDTRWQRSLYWVCPGGE